MSNAYQYESGMRSRDIFGRLRLRLRLRGSIPAPAPAPAPSKSVRRLQLHGSLETFGGPQRHAIAHLKAGKILYRYRPGRAEALPMFKWALPITEGWLEIVFVYF